MNRNDAASLDVIGWFGNRTSEGREREMAYGKWIDTAAGRLYLAAENGKVVRLAAGAAKGQEDMFAGCIEGMEKNRDCNGSIKEPDERSVEVLDRAAGQIMEYLEGKRRTFDVPVEMSGTPFQKKVWEALCGIPYGETRSYGEIAKLVGSPKGARAVGMACGRNPIMILVPCHRVVGSSGKLVGFGGGLPMKEHLLALEGRNG